MTVKVVIDSTADLPPQLAEEMGITVVPLYVLFGDEVYRDGVNISGDEFYHRLLHGPVLPSTTQPTPQDFADVYRKLSQGADGIMSIHASSKLSGTCNSALQGKELVGNVCPIEVFDSQIVSVGMSMLAMEAANIARSGGSLPQVVGEVKRMSPNIHLLGLFDTLEYLARGGRIGKAKELLGSVLNVKPLITVRDGEVVPAGRARTRAKGMEKLVDFVKSATDIQDLFIAHSTTPDDAQALADRIGSIFPRERIIIARLGPVVGTHCGPGTLFAGFRGKGPI